MGKDDPRAKIFVGNLDWNTKEGNGVWNSCIFVCLCVFFSNFLGCPFLFLMKSYMSQILQ